jgi:hypothetical protein
MIASTAPAVRMPREAHAHQNMSDYSKKKAPACSRAVVRPHRHARCASYPAQQVLLQIAALDAYSREVDARSLVLKSREHAR